uniref:Secreted protein n=1 Tax=Peronospora matthiolae TaxID=2874970 RepID=A0AAV1UM89_9STRA
MRLRAPTRLHLYVLKPTRASKALVATCKRQVLRLNLKQLPPLLFSFAHRALSRWHSETGLSARPTPSPTKICEKQETVAATLLKSRGRNDS